MNQNTGTMNNIVADDDDDDGGGNKLFESVSLDIVQHHLLPFLEVSEFMNLSSTCQYLHQSIIEWNDLWRQRCFNKWKSSSFLMNSQRWKYPFKNSQQYDIPNCFNEDIKIGCRWYMEYKRRFQLDKTVLQRLNRIIFRESDDNDNWISLLKDGPDVFEKVQQYAEGNSFTITKESGGLSDIARQVLEGINRFWSCWEYQQLLKKEQSNEDDKLDLVTGAILLSRFYQLGSNLVISGTTLLSLEIKVHNALDEMASVLKQRLQAHPQYNDHNNNHHNMDQLSQNKIIMEEMEYFFQSTQHQDDNDDGKLKGNSADYYDIRNSLLDRILLNTKKGIPITLSIIYAYIVKRATGIQMNPVGIPGHFLLSIGNEHDESRLFVNAFDGGKIMTKQQCQLLVQDNYGITWQDSMANSVSNQEVWARMLRNLVNCHDKMGFIELLYPTDDPNRSEERQSWVKMRNFIKCLLIITEKDVAPTIKRDQLAHLFHLNGIFSYFN